MTQEQKPDRGQHYPSPSHRYWMHDPEGDGMTFFKTAEARDAAAAEAIKHCLDDGSWAPEVTGICVGEVTGVATQIDLVKRPDDLDDEGVDGSGRWWAPGWDYICNYAIRPMPEQA